MKGYLVGYFEEWADDYNSVIVGYYTTWSRALDTSKQLERINLDHHQGLQQVYIVEIEVNKTYSTTAPIVSWIDHYPNYRVQTFNGKTVLKGNMGYTLNLELPEPSPRQNSSPEEQWRAVERRKPKNNSRPRAANDKRGKRLCAEASRKNGLKE